MTYEFRNPVYSRPDNSLIDMEINHPVMGWREWTANPADPEPIGKAMFDAAVAAGNVAPYQEPPAAVPDRVTSRQFMVQLVVAGIKDQVDAWVAQQTAELQVAYQFSGTFVRDDPMMQQGFTEIGFTGDQIDAFFVAAAQL